MLCVCTLSCCVCLCSVPVPQDHQLLCHTTAWARTPLQTGHAHSAQVSQCCMAGSWSVTVGDFGRGITLGGPLGCFAEPAAVIMTAGGRQ